jgi:hypothetical protein
MTINNVKADVIARLRGVHWDDLHDVSGKVPDLLADLASRPGWIGRAFDELLDDEHLRTLSERLAELDKIVLLDDQASGTRIRMHIFRQGYFDRPHNHRFNFATRILTGGYTHTIYGNCPESLNIDAAALTPRIIRHERPGDGYVIEHTLVHSVAAAAETITLTVRGPAQKDRMLIVDEADGAFWAFGMKDEDPQETASRRLTDDRMREIRDLLVQNDLVAGPASSASRPA